MLKHLWTIQDWKTAYQNGQIYLKDLIGYVAEIKNDDHAWIEIASNEQIQSQIDILKDQNIADLPLYGVPFAVKDNIDVAGFHTTAACKEIQYLATQDAAVVAKLKKSRGDCGWKNQPRSVCNWASWRSLALWRS